MLSKSDYRYFSKAHQSALVSDFDKTHVGCIAVYQGNIIAIGCNTHKTHPRQQYYNRFREVNCASHNCLPKMHAEIHCLNAIRNMDINFSRVKLYVYRIRQDQEFGLSRPCASCMAAIRDLGIRQIYYTTNDGYVFEKLHSWSDSEFY